MRSLIIQYAHYDCPVDPSVEWTDTYECAVNGECPACGTKDIEPVEWWDAEEPSLRDAD